MFAKEYGLYNRNYLLFKKIKAILSIHIITKLNTYPVYGRHAVQNKE